jgi:hypothetical protein
MILHEAAKYDETDMLPVDGQFSEEHVPSVVHTR